MGGRVWGLKPINTVKWSRWLIEFRGKGRVVSWTKFAFWPYWRWVACRLWEPAGLVFFPLEDSTRPNTRLWDLRREGEIIPAANRPISLDQIFGIANTHFEQACGGGFGVCECVWVEQTFLETGGRRWGGLRSCYWWAEVDETRGTRSWGKAACGALAGSCGCC